MAGPILDYRIDASRTARRELGVSLEMDVPRTARAGPGDQCKLVLFLPTWTPGSYLVREFSRHLGRVRCTDVSSGEELACRKVAKNRFECAVDPTTQRMRITYDVYAHELSVRTADATNDHAYWNHACVLLWPLGETDLVARLHVVHPADWRVACSLQQTSPEPAVPSRLRTTTLIADGLDAAMDAPCLVGRFERLDWTVDGVPHAIVLDGMAGVRPRASLVDDLTAIVRSANAVFGGRLPYDSYLFLCLFAAEGHGGLEHGESTTLLAARTCFASDKAYREFLGLAAHELFHAWNVKRMRPVEFWRYDYEQENYTELLWLIEGWTAYFDDLLCVRAGVMSREDYLATLAKSANTMLASPGRTRASLRESSFDAWIRLYRPDENTRNSSQNYYVNGSIAALILDVAVRDATDGERSLDDVIGELYRRTYGENRGYAAADVDAVLRSLVGPAMPALLDNLVGRELDPDFKATLACVGVRVTVRDADRPYLGVTFESGSTKVATVNLGSPADIGGVSPGDELIAVEGLRVDAVRWGEVLDAVAKVDQPLRVLLATRGVVAERTVVPGRNSGTLSFEVDENASERQKRLRENWLPGRPAASEKR